MADRGPDINIEEVFVGLRRAWYPPSAAVAASFTRLTQTLGGIYRALQVDPDLAGLHAEVYQDFPGLADVLQDDEAGWSVLLAADDAAEESRRRGPERRASDTSVVDREAERRRKGFYLCNSLIQLMEDVYLDLRLEEEFRHPDNRGWMNLFRHWSRSDTFRIAWAVSASTYGLRFQDFCNRRLGLSLGVTDLTSVWDKAYSPGKTPPEKSPLEAPGASEFDHNEVREIEMLTSESVRGVRNSIADRVEQVLQARLLVPSNRTAELEEIGRRALTPEERKNLLSLNFGIVLITGSIKAGSGSLLTLAVRRHLRDQGLGRRLMRDLVCRLGVREVDLPSAREMSQIGLPAGSREKVRNLFRSVVNEVDLSEQKRRKVPAEPTAVRTRPEAIFGAVPPLPYSGVVRPNGVTWAHAVGFCFWVLAGADGISEDEEKATREALSHWAGPGVHDKETESVAVESREWYLSAKRPPEALVPEVETIIGQLGDQIWFDDEYRKRLTEGFEKIADADKQTSKVEEDMVRRIRSKLGSGSNRQR